MPSRTEQLAQKRHDLQLQCALQRQQLSFISNQVESRLAGADVVLNVVRFIAKNPAVLVGTIATAMILGPWRIFKWASKGAMVFGVIQKVRQLIDK